MVPGPKGERCGSSQYPPGPGSERDDMDGGRGGDGVDLGDGQFGGVRGQGKAGHARARRPHRDGQRGQPRPGAGHRAGRVDAQQEQAAGGAWVYGSGVSCTAARTNVRSSAAPVTPMNVPYGRGGVIVASMAPVAVARTTASVRENTAGQDGSSLRYQSG